MKLRKILRRWLSPPERGTPKYQAIAAAKELSGWLIIATPCPV